MKNNEGRVLGLDFGDTRTGLAISDETRFLASGIGTISEGGMKKTAERVKREAESRSCVKIIIGLPKNMDGSEGFRADAVKAFAEILASICEIPIEFYDERMTTMEAYRFLGETGTFGKKRKNNVDTLSAEIILQSYLDRERAKG
jgi:putative Holliday junction resolvase